ncbi:BQ2448_6086 [Microbotryum intermedium]|uniref:BQ2448_6086 protein n=1 Tax=Microbotryum intermedium TaxID=269621 RepID=A0A238FRC8_9BASI|nr:BQ2448_6086 [Microbotryum intermedium]
MSGRRLYIGHLGPDVQRQDLGTFDASCASLLFVVGGCFVRFSSDLRHARHTHPDWMTMLGHARLMSFGHGVTVLVCPTEGYFGPLGRIVDIRVMGGFAFLEYEDLKDAEAAVADLNGRDFMGDRISVEFAKPPRPREDRFGPPSRGPGGYGDRGGYGGGYGGDRGYDRGGYDRPPPRGPPPPRGFRLVVNGIPDGVSWQRRPGRERSFDIVEKGRFDRRGVEDPSALPGCVRSIMFGTVGMAVRSLDLKDFGRTAGNVGYSDVDRNTGTGFIEYGSRSDADEAIRVLNNTQFNGATVTVEDADLAAEEEEVTTPDPVTTTEVAIEATPPAEATVVTIATIVPLPVVTIAMIVVTITVVVRFPLLVGIGPLNVVDRLGLMPGVVGAHLPLLLGMIQVGTERIEMGWCLRV